MQAPAPGGAGHPSPTRTPATSPGTPVTPAGPASALAGPEHAARQPRACRGAAGGAGAALVALLAAPGAGARDAAVGALARPRLALLALTLLLGGRAGALCRGRARRAPTLRPPPRAPVPVPRGLGGGLGPVASPGRARSTPVAPRGSLCATALAGLAGGVVGRQAVGAQGPGTMSGGHAIASPVAAAAVLGSGRAVSASPGLFAPAPGLPGSGAGTILVATGCALEAALASAGSVSAGSAHTIVLGAGALGADDAGRPGSLRGPASSGAGAGPVTLVHMGAAAHGQHSREAGQRGAAGGVPERAYGGGGCAEVAAGARGAEAAAGGSSGVATLAGGSSGSGGSGGGSRPRARRTRSAGARPQRRGADGRVYSSRYKGAPLLCTAARAAAGAPDDFKQRLGRVASALAWQGCTQRQSA